MTCASSHTLTNASANVKIAATTPSAMPARTTPMSGSGVPINTCPAKSAMAPIAASGAT